MRSHHTDFYTPASEHVYYFLMDSVKLFFLNVFMYVVFLELYVFIYLLQGKLLLALPHFTIFYVWMVSFVAIIIWINIASVGYRELSDPHELYMRAIVSESPFLLLLAIVWLTSLVYMVPSDFLILSGLFTAYMVMFPLILVAARRHHTIERAHKG